MDGQIHRKCQQMAHRGARAIVGAHRNSTQERESARHVYEWQRMELQKTQPSLAVVFLHEGGTARGLGLGITGTSLM
jgi:hypothetical protein